MSLSPGLRLGVYEITGPLGAGGMGQVFRARDTRLNREVAIKALPPDLAADPERLARFEREAQLLAALVHPHIATIHGVVESEGSSFIVLELVEGESLAERLRAGALPVAEALAIARQIADGLQAAHRKGIVHRDLKPANVMLSPDGRVKVLDFGLASTETPPESTAKSGGQLLANSPTLTARVMTQPGVILGTAPYMSPEQAKGGVTDRRTDIWSFGCVLYEMLTGRRPFDGSDVTDVIAAIVRGDPDWSALPAAVPPVVAVYLRRCLQKNPNERVQDIGDMKLALEGAFDVPAPAAGGVQALQRRHSFVIAGGALALAAAAAAAAWLLKPAATPEQSSPQRFVIVASPGPLAIANTNTDLAISPDGSRVAYLAGLGASRALYVRPLDSLSATPLRQITRAFEPFFSPDGRWIAYNDESDYTLRKIPVDGGPPLLIARTRRELLGASWGDDGTIVFATPEGLWRIPPGSSEPEPLAQPDRAKGEITYAWPHLLPGARALLYVIRHGAQSADVAIVALELQTKVTRTLIRGGTSPRYSHTGHLVYGIEKTLRAVRFDAERLAVSGDPVAVLDDVLTKASGAVDFGIARDGTLMYVSGASALTPKRLAFVDREGNRRPLKAPAHPYTLARLSPDGGQVALELRDHDSNLWIWDITREQLRQLTSGAAFDGLPLWVDNRRVLFASSRNGNLNVFLQSADGSDAVQLLASGPSMVPMCITPDRGTALVRQEGTGAGEDIMSMPITPNAKLVPVLATEFAESNADISPDGRWMVYQSNEAGGTVEVFVRPYPNVHSARWPITNGGGLQPMWTSGGAEILYVAADGKLMRVAVDTRAGFSAGPPTVAVDPPFYAGNLPRTYDATRDGTQILIIEDVPGTRSSSDSITVVLNWGSELRRLVSR